jgi:hypothetical protein
MRAWAGTVIDSANAAMTISEIVEENTSWRLIVCFHNANQVYYSHC